VQTGGGTVTSTSSGGGAPGPPGATGATGARGGNWEPVVSGTAAADTDPLVFIAMLGDVVMVEIT
jgi:hypothetical protein